MEKHRVLHSGIIKEICDECGKAFALHSYLVRHQMLHQKERDIQMGIIEEQERHLCSECGKVFSKAHYLSRHLERHIRGKCYECRICGKKFSQRMNRINHEFLHTKTKDYECHICEKKFALKCYLKIHVQRHLNALNNPETKRRKRKLCKDFKCSQCNKTYTSIKYLQAHEKYHQDPKKFVCAKPLPHVLHTNGFSFVCVLSWIRNKHGLVKDFSQYWQWCLGFANPSG
jgi:KRAB domain-containing zinc finger protein